MNLQTKIPLKQQKHNQIDYNSKLLLLGSCFAENIGEKLTYFKFQNDVNPFGVLFHPLAIEQLITQVINEKEYTDEDVFFHNEQWHSFETHTRLSRTSKSELLVELNVAIQNTISQLKEATLIVITLGTAWAYRHIETDTLVANCHKVPQKRFLKEILSIDTIQESLEATINLIRSVNPKVNFIFTISPVRHLKDGFVENQRSKSHLISAVHQVIANQRRNSHYFPSYEILMDELRDYRFYKEDMIHPNQTAIDYIWERFCEQWMSESTLTFSAEIDSLQKGIRHKPFNPNSEAHHSFLQKLEAQKKRISARYPHISF